MSTVDPDIGARIYAWVRDGNVVYRGRAAAELILSRQLESIAGLKRRGLAVKVNTIMIPGVNTIDNCAPIRAVAEKARELGVDLMNVMALCSAGDGALQWRGGGVSAGSPGRTSRPGTRAGRRAST